MSKPEHESDHPLSDHLAEALLYAPIGLVYEHKEVWATLVRRGKSQVNLARFMAKSAPDGRAGNWEQMVAEVVGEVAATTVQILNDVGSFFGLADPPQQQASPSSTASASEGTASAKQAAGEDASEADPNPIKDYESKTVKQVLPLLADLTTSELAAVRSAEESGKARKSILDRIDRLLS